MKDDINQNVDNFTTKTQQLSKHARSNWYKFIKQYDIMSSLHTLKEVDLFFKIIIHALNHVS
jgi:uncharacterized protein YeeX (DUF496 family)